MRELDVAGDFGDFEGRVWLNCAHQGPLPDVAAEELREALQWKRAPHQLTTERFGAVPRRVRAALARFLGVPSEDVILGNSAAYGLHLLANGLPLDAGDEVLVMHGDFPSNILPWLGRAEQGIVVRQIRPARQLLTVDEVEAAIGSRTRALCMSWVHSFSGRTADLGRIGALCRSRNVLLLINASQALGPRVLDLARDPVDAVVGVGFKWLCGPYGTGYCWIRPDLRERLRYNQNYWLAMQTADDLRGPRGEVRIREGLGARRYDVFGTANFFNFKPWAASLEYLFELGPARIRCHDEMLVSRFVDGLDRSRYELISPAGGPERSTLIFISDRRPEQNPRIQASLARDGIDIASRDGRLRIAPHIYNTVEQIDRTLELLARS